MGPIAGQCRPSAPSELPGTTAWITTSAPQYVQPMSVSCRESCTSPQHKAYHEHDIIACISIVDGGPHHHIPPFRVSWIPVPYECRCRTEG